MIPPATDACNDPAGSPRPKGAPSIRSLLLKELTIRRDQGEDISSRKLSSVLAKQYGCSRALVIGARRTVLESGHSQAFDELRLHFGHSTPGEIA